MLQIAAVILVTDRLHADLKRVDELTARTSQLISCHYVARFQSPMIHDSVCASMNRQIPGSSLFCMILGIATIAVITVERVPSEDLTLYEVLQRL